MPLILFFIYSIVSPANCRTDNFRAPLKVAKIKRFRENLGIARLGDEFAQCLIHHHRGLVLGQGHLCLGVRSGF